MRVKGREGAAKGALGAIQRGAQAGRARPARVKRHNSGRWAENARKQPGGLVGLVGVSWATGVSGVVVAQDAADDVGGGAADVAERQAAHVVARAQRRLFTLAAPQPHRQTPHAVEGVRRALQRLQRRPLVQHLCAMLAPSMRWHDKSHSLETHPAAPACPSPRAARRGRRRRRGGGREPSTGAPGAAG